MRKFIVAGVQRSGTTLVTTSLDSHPDIHCAGELFKMRRPRGRVEVLDGGYRAYLDSALWLKLADRLLRRRVVYGFLDGFFEHQDFKAVGFKLMNNHTVPGQFPMAVPYLIDRQVSIIHVIRENVFKTYLSRLVAQNRRVFHATQEPGELPRLTVPTTDLKRKLSRIEEQGSRLTELFSGSVPYVACVYENYVADPQAEGWKLLSFLGVPVATLRSPLVKLGSDDLSEVVDNMDEVRLSVRGTRYEKWIV